MALFLFQLILKSFKIIFPLQEKKLPPSIDLYTKIVIIDQVRKLRLGI